MKHVVIIAALLTAAGASLPAVALANADLAKAKNCMACHAAATKLVGPSFKDIAARYKGQKDAPAKLAPKLIKGSSGAWGPMPMPPNPQVSDSEAQALVKWVLEQK